MVVLAVLFQVWRSRHGLDAKFIYICLTLFAERGISIMGLVQMVQLPSRRI